MHARTERIEFTNGEGEKLAGRLEWPVGEPSAFAIFAHCFTCSKDARAAVDISRALAAEGFAVLRFDFTGLGNSEGDFANTHFSSNIQDLISAADHLREHHEAPRLLIGHSLGGAAVLAAAKDIDEVEAIATIGAPADPGHVEHLVSGAIEDIERDGEGTAKIGGREFKIKKEFIDDIKSFEQSGDIGKRALLVMHSPVDNVVGIENAEQIYKRVRGYKSFITLAGADHMLSNKADAKYAAEVIAAWSDRYVTKNEQELPTEEGKVTVTEIERPYTNRVIARQHQLYADEPPSADALDMGPSPYEYLVAALGACTSMTLRMYAERKDLPLDRVTVHLEHDKVHAKDCEDCETTEGKIDVIRKHIVIDGDDLTDDQRTRLKEIAEKCPVNKTLLGEIKIEQVED